MRALHVVKTSDGAPWAARLAKILGTHGVDVHVALPNVDGRTVADWERAGATIHVADLNLPVRSPYKLPSLLKETERLVRKIAPDIIHSHFVSTTMVLRMALGKKHRVPRIYQVAGPLHLEHRLPRTAELSLAGESDYWIGSSRCIIEHYRNLGVSPDRIFLSYYGWFDETDDDDSTSGELRKMVGAQHSDIIVGNVNFMYPPKYYLGQRVGLKCHEDVIDALGEVMISKPDVLGVLVGGTWGKTRWYENNLRHRAWTVARNRIRFTGPVSFAKARSLWRDFDVAVHVPMSENTGGVPEPMAVGVPVIASIVGGLPEVVLRGRTGWLVQPRDPKALARAINNVLDNRNHARDMAAIGQRLVLKMFDAERTGNEVFDIYQHILGKSRVPPPSEFESETFVDSLTHSLQFA